MVFPAAKLLTVALRQLSKPMASYMQRRAQNSEAFKAVCVGLASRYNMAEQHILDRFYGRSSKGTRRLNEAKAIELGASVFGEIFIFSIAAVALGFEYTRSVRKDAAKERELMGRLGTLEAQILQLQAENDRLLCHVFPDEHHARQDVDVNLTPGMGWLSWLAQPITGLFGPSTETHDTDNAFDPTETDKSHRSTPRSPGALLPHGEAFTASTAQQRGVLSSDSALDEARSASGAFPSRSHKETRDTV